MDKRVVARIDTHMSDTRATVREEDQIARLKLGARDLCNGRFILARRRVGKAYIEMSINILCEAGTVKALGRCTAVNIGRTEQRCGIVDYLLTCRRSRCRGGRSCG